MKEFADDNFNFQCDENGRKFFKWMKKKNVQKGEIACYQQFLFPRCSPQTRQSMGLFGKDHI